MTDAYTAEWRHKIKELAAERNIPLNEGVYLWALGPCFETAAEIKMFRLLGGDAVGMSTVPEVICAAHESAGYFRHHQLRNRNEPQHAQP